MVGIDHFNRNLAAVRQILLQDATEFPQIPLWRHLHFSEVFNVLEAMVDRYSADKQSS